ncbi:MAG: hypothetical protein ACP5KW_06325 [Thermoproteota archaeon]|jgi:hypothetical protein
MSHVEERVVGGIKTRFFKLGNFILGIPYEIGPRILYLASSKSPNLNLFGVVPEMKVETSEGLWRIYGGHRLWSSPEAMPRSYSLDDKPVQIEAYDEEITIHGNPERENSVQKEITIKLNSDGSLKVEHKIKNIGRWPIKFACWAISLMKKEGFAIIPIKPSKVDERGLLPDRHISLWPYTNLSDSRINFSENYIFLRQDSSVKLPIKIGTKVNPSWVAYYTDGLLFIKEIAREGKEYPDFDCNAEVYTNSEFLELETLGPLELVEPFQSAQHTETWKILEVGKLEPRQEDVEQIL